MEWPTKESLKNLGFTTICKGNLLHDQMSILMPGLQMEEGEDPMMEEEAMEVMGRGRAILLDVFP